MPERVALRRAAAVFALLTEDSSASRRATSCKWRRGRTRTPAPRLVKLTRGMKPLANTWYLKAVTDHLLFNQLAEMASPGYLSKVRARAQREFGQSFYWDPAQ